MGVRPAISILGGLLVFSCATRSDAGQAVSASDIRNKASGSFLFSDRGTDHPMRVWFCRPSSITADTRVVFVMHGSESQTARQACEIASPYLQPLDAVVLAPQFSEEFFPGDAYMFGNMIDAVGKAVPKSMWAFTVIERLFDFVRDTLRLRKGEYDIVGFSGGEPSASGRLARTRKAARSGRCQTSLRHRSRTASRGQARQQPRQL